jgi:phosphoserine phosphatase
MAQYEALGQAAQELNERIKPMLGGANELENVAGAMIEIEAGGRDLAAKAQALVEQANGHGFSDINRLADALRQQLQAALNKVKLLGTKVARA